MFANKPITLEECKTVFDNTQDTTNLEKLITIVNYEIINILVKNKLIKSNRPIVVLKFSMHFGITKDLIIDNLSDLQILVNKLKDVFIEEGYKVSTHNQSDGTIIFSLSLPYNIEPTFV